jgi:NADH-quinone oxidoreductase subunit F
VRAEAGEPFVVANGAEGEPGSIKDRHLMRTRPQDVLAGLAIAARAVGAREAVVYLKGSFETARTALEAALREAPPRDLEVRIVRGEEGYVAGEETAVLETLEGRRPWPRSKPPMPSGVGYRGRPTLIHNVETLARLPLAVSDPEGFHASEATFVSVWGQVRVAGVHEVRLGTPIGAIIETCGGAPDGVGMILPTGPSGAPLPAEALDTPLDPVALREAGSALGTASLLIVGASACPVSVAASAASFFERESCGQCPPCSLGTANLGRILRALESGTARAKDITDVSEVAGFVSSHGYCAHGRTAAGSVTGFLARFRDDVAAHIRAGRCPRPEGRADPFADGSPERTVIEALA